MSGFRRGGAGRRRDANEQTIVSALLACKARVYRLSGAGIPDLLVRYGGVWTPLELKRPGGKRTAAQVAAGAGQDWAVVDSVSAALAAVGVLGRSGRPIAAQTARPGGGLSGGSRTGKG